MAVLIVAFLSSISVFSRNAIAQSHCILAVGGARTGEVHAIHGLPGGGALIGADRGLFRFDPAAGALAAAGGARTGTVYAIQGLPGGGALIGSYEGVFRFGPADVGTLIGAPRGRLRYDPTGGIVRPAGGASTGSAPSIHGLPGGGALIDAHGGLFRFDPATGTVAAVGRAGAGRIKSIHGLPGGGALIGADRGLFRFDPAAGALAAAGDARTGTVYAIQGLPGGGALIGADRGWFRYDPATGTVVGVGAAEKGGRGEIPEIRGIHELPGGGALIGTRENLSLVPGAALMNATVATVTDLRGFAPSPNAVEVRLRFEHPCAPASDHMGLALVAATNGAERRPTPVRHPHDAPPSATTATLAAPTVFDRPGAWTLALRQGAIVIGQPLRFTIAGPTWWQRVAQAWDQVATVIAVLYALAFGTLLLLTRRSAAAFRVLSDSAWAKWLTWPFFFLRHVPSVQGWVLEPWFQAVRRDTRRDALFLDPPVSTAERQRGTGTALLGRLRDTPRLWLWGRSGMGKSSVFAAWERAFFAAENAPTLAAAVRRHGFVLVTLRVRHYAGVPPPEAGRPETWVLEAVRRRLEQSGLETRDLGLVEAMLRAGHVALALDGTNEADRDAALAAFARQFPMVRLLASSQAAGGEGWQTWRLPEDVAALREDLLKLWLGAEKGGVLARRIVAEGLADTVVSGYDLRLLADLVGTDPDRAPLPADRIGLYRAMLARATDATGQPLRPEGLKQVAWTMMTQRRREITAEDEKVLGAGTLAALARQEMPSVRQVGTRHEFRHDQMRAFLAALWLDEETPTARAIGQAADGKAFALNRRDQEELWRFVAPLLPSDEDLVALWHFSNEEPADRGLLLAALQAEADARGVVLVRPARGRARSAKRVPGRT